jgi:hypothetical protein
VSSAALARFRRRSVFSDRRGIGLCHSAFCNRCARHERCCFGCAGRWSLPTQRALSHLTLSRLTLSHLTLSHLTLSHVTLSHVTLSHVTLSHVTLSHLTLPRGRWSLPTHRAYCRGDSRRACRRCTGGRRSACHPGGCHRYIQLLRWPRASWRLVLAIVIVGFGTLTRIASLQSL